MVIRYGLSNKLNFLLGRQGEALLEVTKLLNATFANTLPWHSYFNEAKLYDMYFLQGGWHSEAFE